MIYSDVIIIGGGPAGSTCAWKLKQNKIKCIILDKEKFPRTKLCAGWITPEVVSILELKNYPKGILKLNNIYFYLHGKKRKLKTLQYSIRRYELDDWLLKRSKAKLYKHNVINIQRKNKKYIIDNKFSCKYIIGAGGTYCPVYKKFFKNINPRAKESLITAMEQEFKYNYKEKDCLLWFFDNKLPGYSWYVPKSKNYINIGVGGAFIKNSNIKNQWDYFVKKLEKLSLIKNIKLNPKGYIYYTRQNIKKARIDNAFIIGDSAGLATKDLAEGIGPAVKSGILAAESIINNTKFSLDSIPKKSLNWLMRLKAIIS